MSVHPYLYIVGAGSVGAHVALNLDCYGLQYEQVYFVDDDVRKHGLEVVGVPVLGGTELLYSVPSADVIIGIAFPRIKQLIFNKLIAQVGLHYPTLIAKQSWVSKDVQVGRGSIIYPGCSVNYGCDIGDFVVMNMNCAIGHNVSIGDFSALAPGVNLAGYSQLEALVDMGIGAATRQRVRVGTGAIIGGQSMLINDVPADTRVAGVPAKTLV